MSYRTITVALLFLLAIAPGLWLVVEYPDFPHFGVFTDDSIYFLNARSIAEGAGYRMLSQPGAPPQVKYPPLFPLLLAAAWKLEPRFPENLTVALRMVWLLIPLYLCLCRLAFRRFGFGPVESAMLCLWLGVSPLFNFMSVSLLSEL